MRSYLLLLSAATLGFLTLTGASLKANEPPCLAPDGRPCSGQLRRNLESLEAIQTQVRSASEPAGPSLPEAAAYWKQVPEVVAYATHSKVESVIAAAKRDATAPKNCDKCYRFVKYALCYPDLKKRANCTKAQNHYGPCTRNAIVPSYPEGVFARQALGVLKQKQNGFINLLEGPHAPHIRQSFDNIPKGAILIYRNKDRPRGPGHIEIKSDWGPKARYLHFLNNPHSIADNRLAPSASRRYELIGVMIKPKVD